MSLDFTIRLYELLADGTLEPQDGGQIDQYGGSCPNVGDTIAKYDVLAEGFKFYNVQRRMFIDSADTDEGWAILIRAVDASPLMSAVADEWLDETKFWRDVDEKESWSYKLAERNKHQPLHNLDSREMGVLRFMADHPEGLTVDAIPRAGEKTMQSLKKVGVVRPFGKDDRGFRRWLVTKEGLAEIKRSDTYSKWKFE